MKISAWGRKEWAEAATIISVFVAVLSLVVGIRANSGSSTDERSGSATGTVTATGAVTPSGKPSTYPERPSELPSTESPSTAHLETVGEYLNGAQDVLYAPGEYPASGNNGSAVYWDMATSINGNPYPTSVVMAGFSDPVTYILGREFRSFRAVVGVTDDSTSNASVRIEIDTDSKVAFRKTLSIGHDMTVTLNLTGVSRLVFEMYGTQFRGRLVWLWRRTSFRPDVTLSSIRPLRQRAVLRTDCDADLAAVWTGGHKLTDGLRRGAHLLASLATAKQGYIDHLRRHRDRRDRR